eukprot:3125348-Prymnesium_polylepis.1
MADDEQKFEQEREARQFRLWPQERSAYPHILKLELKTFPEEHQLRMHNLGCRSFARVIKKVYRTPTEKARSPKHDGQYVLLSLLSAPEGSQLLSLARTLSRIEPLSHVLVWTKRSRLVGEAPWSNNGDQQLGLIPDLVELPRLKLSLRAEKHGDEWRLCEKCLTANASPTHNSVDHSKLYVLDVASESESLSPARQLAACCPHALILRSENAEYSVVVPNVRPVRPQVGNRPFSTELVLDRLSKPWVANAATSYFTFGVHASGAFLTPPTLASALYLLVLKLMARDYAGASALFSSISTDSELTAEESQIFDVLGDLKAGSPDFHAVRAKVMLTQADAPTVIPWDVRQEQAYYASKLSHVSARCRLSDEEERISLQMCVEQKEKLKVISEQMNQLDNRKKSLIFMLIWEERRDERYMIERKPLADFLQAARVRDARGRIDCAPVHEMLLYNRQQLLETLQEQQALHSGQQTSADKKRAQREKEGKPKKTKAEKSGQAGDGSKEAKRAKNRERRLKELEGAPEGFKFCHCKAQAPPPPASGASAWICRKDDTAASGDFKEEFESGALTYSMTWISWLPSNGLNWIRIIFENDEDVTGSEGIVSGFLLIYELFTTTKELVFRGKSTTQQNHTFATLWMRFIKGIDEKGLMQSILHTMARNPWVCSVMPKWNDTRSDSYNSFVRYSGWKEIKSASDFLGSDEDPVSRLLFKAQETLQQLKEKGLLLDEAIPPCGFVPPVVLPEGNLLLDAAGGEEPARATHQPPHSGAHTAKGAMQKPQGSIRLTLRKCPSATAASGE